ncbi:10349_t:CDS:1, partial [Scutellospora calospora]
LDAQQLKQIQNEMSKSQVPLDIGQIPRKVDCEEGFANFTADE